MTIQDQEVTAVAVEIFKATDLANSGRQTYLRILATAAQDALGHKKGQEFKAQMTALKSTHERFYALCMAAASDVVPKGTKERALELHKRCNFARTALSSLRNHVRAGGDICALQPSKLTKGALRRRDGPTRPLNAGRLKSRAERESKRLVATLMGLADADKAAAVSEIQLVLGQLSTQLVQLGVVATKDAATAAADMKLLRIGKTLFMPTDTAVLRARPQ